MVVICGENNYKLDTKHVIDGVVVEDTRESEVNGRGEPYWIQRYSNEYPLFLAKEFQYIYMYIVYMDGK